VGLSLTRGQIITDGLDLAGRPDLTSQARLWLNTYLDQQYQSQDMYWTQKSSTLSATNGVSLPSDYRANIAAHIVDGGSRTSVEMIDNYDRWLEIKDGYDSSQENIPQYVFVDGLNETLQFLPSPKSGISLELTYYSSPALPDHTDASTDALSPVWRMPVEVLINHIKVKAMEYNDDDRFLQAKQLQEKDFANAKMNNFDRRGGPQRLKMGKRFKKRTQ